VFSSFDHREPPFDPQAFRRAVFFSLLFTGLMWMVKLLELAGDYHWQQMGIYPRTLTGSIGIFLSPFIHDDAWHLLSNTFPAIVLTGMLFYFYQKIAIEVFCWIYVCTGIWVWAFARSAYHIGASGIIYGLAAFLLVSGFKSRNIQLISVSFIVLFLYGGMFYGVAPYTVDSNVSWESHLLGSFSGVLFALIFVRTKKTKQEDEEVEQLSGSTDDTSGGSFHYHYIYKPSKKENPDNDNHEAGQDQ